MSSCPSSLGPLSEGGSSPGGGAMSHGTEVSDETYSGCVKKHDGSKEPSPFWNPRASSEGIKYIPIPFV